MFFVTQSVISLLIILDRRAFPMCSNRILPQSFSERVLGSQARWNLQSPLPLVVLEGPEEPTAPSCSR